MLSTSRLVVDIDDMKQRGIGVIELNQRVGERPSVGCSGPGSAIHVQHEQATSPRRTNSPSLPQSRVVIEWRHEDAPSLPAPPDQLGQAAEKAAIGASDTAPV